MLKAEEFSTFLSAIVPACPLCGIQYNRVVGQNVGREQHRRCGNPSAVTVWLTHFASPMWVSHSDYRTISTRKTAISGGFSRFLVRDGRLELPTSCSQSRRATNCANPGYLVLWLFRRCSQSNDGFTAIIKCVLYYSRTKAESP